MSTATERREQIEAVCLRLLTRREHSRRELLDKLMLRGYRADEIEPVIDALADEHWQDDGRYAESYVRQRIQRGYGPLRIAYELQQRGVNDAAMDIQAEEFGGWPHLALHVYRNSYDGGRFLTRKEWLKRSRFLQQRGFSGDMIKYVFSEMKVKFCQADVSNETLSGED